MRSMVFATMLITMGVGFSSLGEAPFTAPKGKVRFTTPKDGATVSSPVKVVMASTVKIRPAGQDPNDHQTGHHHLIVDSGPVPKGEVIAADETHLHFGKGQTEAEVKLAPGPHTLTLQFADGAHRSYGPGLSQTIHITVK